MDLTRRELIITALGLGVAVNSLPPLDAVQLPWSLEDFSDCVIQVLDKGYGIKTIHCSPETRRDLIRRFSEEHLILQLPWTVAICTACPMGGWRRGIFSFEVVPACATFKPDHNGECLNCDEWADAHVHSIAWADPLKREVTWL